MQAAHAGASDASTQKGDPKKNGWLLLAVAGCWWLLLAVGGYIRLPAGWLYKITSSHHQYI